MRAKLIREREMYGVAAVASARAADLYLLSALAREIENDPEGNTTRFVMLERQPAAASLRAEGGMLKVPDLLKQHTPARRGPATRG